MPSRAAKELRTLLLPSGLILAASALAGFWASQWSRTFYGLGVTIAESSFYIGTPLLAAWSVGAEFQQRTLSLLLTQPVSRSRVWLEKWLSLALMATLLLAVQVAALDVGPFRADYPPSARLLWVAAMLGSAPLWTLVARSTIGGLAFSIGAAALLETAASFISQWFAPPGTPRQMFAQTPLLTTLRVLYPLLTFALGWWTFSRLEVASFEHSMADGTGAGSLPLLRHRRSGPLRNMFITGMRVYRPAWVMAVIFSACWLAVLAAGASGVASQPAVEPVLAVLMSSYVALAIVLAGTLSIAEDATLGIHVWHLTLPLATRTQWLVKLAVSFAAAIVLIILIPSAVWTLTSLAKGTGPIGPAPLVRADALVLLASLVVLCFWAATLFGHTVRAAAAAAAVLAALAIGATTLSRVSYEFAVFDGLLTWLMVRWQVPPDYFTWPFSTTIGRHFLTGLPLVVLTIGLIQSLYAFRRAQVGGRWVGASIATMIGAGLLTTFALVAYGDAGVRLTRSSPALELREAIEASLPAGPQGTSRPIAIEELRRTGLVSPATLKWIEGTRMTATFAGRARGGRMAEVRVEFAGQRQHRFIVRIDENRPAPR